MQLSFQSCFKAKSSLVVKSESPTLQMEASRNQFKRESLNGSLYESNHERSRNDDDESFKDIVDRIIN